MKSKEEILKSIDIPDQHENYCYSEKEVLAAMEEYATQQVAHEAEKALKLLEALEFIKKMTNNVSIRVKINDAITDYKK